MGAILICPDRNEWEIIRNFLADCEEGAVVVAPDVVDAIKDAHGVDLREDAEPYLDQYDFGGQADVLIDWVADTDHTGVPELLQHMGVAVDEFGEPETRKPLSDWDPNYPD